MLIDVINDQAQGLLKEKIKIIGFNDERLEKVASLDVPEREELTPEAFAWPEEKMFPIYTPSHALVSSIYLENNDSVPDFVKVACEQACELFGYEIDLSGHYEKTAMDQSEPYAPLTPDDYLLPGREKLPIIDSDSYNLSKAEFMNNTQHLTFDEVVVGANQLIKKAELLGKEIDEPMIKLALQGSINTSQLTSYLRDRELLTSDRKYGTITTGFGGETVSSIEKVAAIVKSISILDQENGLTKTAAETITDIVNPNGNSNILQIGVDEYSFDKIAEIDPSDWREVFSETVVQELFKHNGEDIDRDGLQRIANNYSDDEKEALSYFINSKI